MVQCIYYKILTTGFCTSKSNCYSKYSQYAVMLLFKIILVLHDLPMPKLNTYYISDLQIVSLLRALILSSFDR